MTNFEKITQSETTLADCLYYVINCDQCPIGDECSSEDCFKMICEWLKREA